MRTCGWATRGVGAALDYLSQRPGLGALSGALRPGRSGRTGAPEKGAADPAGTGRPAS